VECCVISHEMAQQKVFMVSLLLKTGPCHYYLLIYIPTLNAQWSRQEVLFTSPFCLVYTTVQDHLLKLNQQAPKLQDLKERAASLLTSDLCQQYDPAHNLREQCREMEGKWRNFEDKLQLALEDMEEKVWS